MLVFLGEVLEISCIFFSIRRFVLENIDLNKKLKFFQYIMHHLFNVLL